MLVLTRRTLQSVAVGDPDRREPLIKVTVLQIKGGAVKLGFLADTQVPVHRWEVWERLCADGGPDRSANGPADVLALGADESPESPPPESSNDADTSEATALTVAEDD